MEDDGVFLNISTSRSVNGRKQQPVVSAKASKTDLKRQKYSKKMKLATMRNRSSSNPNKYAEKKQDSGFERLENVQFVKNDPKKRDERAKEEEKSIKNSKIRSRPKISDKDDLKDEPKKRINSKNSHNQWENTERNFRQKKLPPSVFKPQNLKKVKVQELLAEEVNLKNKIDNAQLQNFDLHQKLKESLEKSGVTKLTEIQVKAFKPLSNFSDSVMKANTGSGKTLAYLIPIINKIVQQKLMEKRQDGTVVIVVCPTRELCVQGQKQVLRCLKRLPFIVPGCLYGGEDTNHEKARLRKGTNILFCTPGRVLYHLQNTQSFKLDKLKSIIFEQADRTLDMGFEEVLNKIIDILAEKTSLNYLNKVLVSAHFNTKVSDLLQKLEMSEPKFIGFDEDMNLKKLKVSKDLEINTSSQLKQQYILLSEDEKIPLMIAYLGVLRESKALIFVSTIDEVEYFDYLLNNLMYRDSNGMPTQSRVETRPVYKIHGDLDQKLRSKTYLDFRASKEAILISTQVAARGLDFPDLSHIILFDVPPSITDYGNRVGRSARFNETGVSLLMLHYQESDYAEKIRYYAPDLQVVNKDVIFGNFQRILKSMNIGDESLHYIEGLVRASVKDDDEKYQVARKAYVSMLRAYARLPDHHIFHVKKLNLKLLARTFGLNNAQADKAYNPKAKQSHLEAIRKKRKVQDIKRLQVSEYL